MRHIESRLQAACVRWARLQYPELQELLISVPNGAKLTPTQAKFMKAEGMVSGVADMLLLIPCNGYPYMAIEFKTAKGRQSDSQKTWQIAAEKYGACYVIVRDFEGFKDYIDNWMKNI